VRGRKSRLTPLSVPAAKLSTFIDTFDVLYSSSKVHPPA